MHGTLGGPLAARNALFFAVLAGILHGICFPPLGAWPLAFVSLAPLVAAARGRTVVAGGLLGWLAGTIASTITAVPWIAAAAHDYFRHGFVGAVVFASALLQVFGALPIALFGAAVARLSRLQPAPLRVLASAAAWTALELARARALTGAPWDLLAHALYAQPLWIQLADLGGAFAVSFVLAACAAAAAELVVGNRRDARAAVAIASVLVAATVAYGAVRLRGVRDDAEPVLRVALVQGNVPNSWRLVPARAGEAFRAFADTTRPLVGTRPDLIVWPENALSVLLGPNPRFASAAAELLGADGPPLLLGAPRSAPAGDGRVRFFNSAYLLSSAGDELAVYDKRRLVPFAEYAPIARLPGFGFRYGTPTDYVPGGAPVVFSTPVPFGVLICFEAIYPELVQPLVRQGARFLVNISNDTWFEHGGGLEQHFAAAVFRAVENRRALARVTNAGVTALVGPSGRIVARLAVGVTAAGVFRVPLREDQTLYARMGDVFAWGTVLLALAAVIMTPSGTRPRT